MSRTKKSKKGPGYEYWSKRPGSRNHGTAPGRESKKLTHRLERIEGKDEIVEQLDLNDLDVNGHLSAEAIEDAAIRSAQNMGAAQDIFHPDYGWIMRKGELTEAGIKFCEDYPDFSYEEEN